MDKNKIKFKQLIDALDSTDWSTRWNAIRELGNIKSVEAVKYISKFLNDPDPDIKFASEEALLNIGTDEAMELVDKQKNKDLQIQKESILKKELEKIDKHRARLLNKEISLNQRLESLDIIYESKTDDLLSVLEICINDPNVRLQRKAFQYFSNITTDSHIPTLIKKLSHPDEEIKLLALQSLYKHTRDINPQRFFPLIEDLSISADFLAELLKFLIKFKDDNVNKKIFQNIYEQLKSKKDKLFILDPKYDKYKSSPLLDSIKNYLKKIDNEKTSNIINEITKLMATERRKAKLEFTKKITNDIKTIISKSSNIDSIDRSDIYLLGSHYFQLYILPFLMKALKNNYNISSRLPGTLIVEYNMSFHENWAGSIANSFVLRLKNTSLVSKMIVQVLEYVLLNHPDWTVRYEAAHVLRALKDESSLPALKKAFEDNETDVSDEARDAWKEISNGDIFTLEESFVTNIKSDKDVTEILDELGFSALYTKNVKNKIEVVKVTCKKCGSKILQQTFNKYNGLCARCFKSITEGEKSKACYIATATYMNYNHPKVIIYRNFRDKYLSKKHWGKIFIHNYYIFSPFLASLINLNPLLQTISKLFLEFLSVIIIKCFKKYILK